MYEQDKRELLAELADAEDTVARQRQRAASARADGRDRDAAHIEACAAEDEKEVARLRQQCAAAGITVPPSGAVAPRAHHGSGAPSQASSPPANFDVGDQIVELQDARREGREPAAWATQPIGATAKRTAAEPPPPANVDVGDQILELRAARREGREPAAWATRPLPSTNQSGARRA